MCFLKSKRKKLTILLENPNIADWWNRQEIMHATPEQSLFDVYRDLSVEKLVELSKQPFRKAIDLHQLRQNEPQLFDVDMDLGFDCFCKST